MILFLYGQDTYRSRQKLNEIVNHYQEIHKGGLNLKYFDLKKENYDNFWKEMQSASMFAGKKLIVLENAFLNEQFKTNFLKDSKRFLDSKDIILFYEEESFSAKDKFFGFLKKNSKLQEFRPLGEKSLRNWVKKEIENKKIRIEPKALSCLVYYVGNDLWRMASEINKILAYKIKEKAPIVSKEDIELLVKPKIEIDIFKTIDAISLKNKREALSLIHQHLERGDSPLYLLSMINFQFRNLLTVKSYELGCEFNANYPNMRIISQKLAMHPFVVRKTLRQAKRFNLEELKKIYQKIFEKDLAIKTGKIDPGIALDTLIAEI